MLNRHVALVFACSFVVALHAQTPPALIPRPAIFREKTGAFHLDARVTVAATDAGEPLARRLQAAIFEQTGLRLPFRYSDEKPLTGKRLILIRYAGENAAPASDDLAAEGYFLKISADTILLDAPRQQGQFYALQTLRQLIGFQGNKLEISLPACDIADAPGFDYRGLMLDCGRHFLPLDYLKKQVDAMAFYKLNVLRLHLTEDQGWRIEIKKYPELTRRAAWRTEADGTTHGGFYTQTELRELVAYAAERNVEIIPEIEMPGHCSAALAAYPALSCRGAAMPVPHNWGVFQDVFCAGNDSVFAFLSAVLEEVVQIFPSQYVHVGGDEVPKNRWQECPRCQARIRAEGLRDEHELQAYFMRRIQRFLAERGRTMIGWDEILDGGADPQAVIEVWQDIARARPALAAGHRVILAPASDCYLNRPPGDLTLEKVFRFDPLADTFFLYRASKIIGLEAPLWTEHITTANGDNMLYPRALAFANTAWTGGGDTDFPAFQRRLAQHLPMLDSMGVDYGPADRNLFRYDLKFSPGTKKWTFRAERGLRDLNFRYLTDREEFEKLGVPLEKTAFSPQFAFDEMLVLDKPARFKVAPFRREKQYAEAAYFALRGHLALGKSVAFEPKYDARYPTAGDLGLTDGRLGSLDFNDGAWLGWWGEDMSATLRFDTATALRRVSVNFIQQSKSWILLPATVEFYTSDDGQDWQLAWVNEFKINALDEQTFIAPSVWDAPPDTRAKHLRVVARNFGTLPKGHNGAGGKAWIFADEIVME